METIDKYNNSLLLSNSFDLDNEGRVIAEITKNNRKLNRAITSSRYLSLILMPTENCNFRCTYCYEDFSIGRMKDSIVSGIKSFLSKRCAELDYINIEWFGGEPLLAKDIILDISQFMISMAYINPQLRYSSSMTTNAYMLDEKMIANLSRVGIRTYQISLDGPKEIHDRSRLRADGASTFEKIWSNLLAIRDSLLPVKVLLRIHITIDNQHFLDSLLEDIQREFLPDPRFSVFFKAIERLGGANDNEIKQFSHEEHDIVMNLLKTKMFGEDHSISQNGELPDDYICYASRPNSLIIRANGDIGKCTVALYDERNKIATLQPDGTMEVIPGRLAPWVRGLETLDPVTLACPLNGLPLENK